jgi:uncharacterized protein YdbL (DUF1318 family)
MTDAETIAAKLTLDEARSKGLLSEIAERFIAGLQRQLAEAVRQIHENKHGASSMCCSLREQAEARAEAAEKALDQLRNDHQVLVAGQPLAFSRGRDGG